MPERRKFSRVKLNEMAMWRKADTFDNLSVIKDISEGGVCFETNDLKLSCNDVVQLAFQLPSKKIIHSKALVSWVSAVDPGRIGWQAGVSFEDISDSDRQDIQHYIGECRYG